MTEKIIIKPSVQKRFDSFMAHGRVLFFSAPCGFGKTVLADALLRGRKVLRKSGADPDGILQSSAQDWDILLIDDFQLMQEEAEQQALCERIRSSPERRYVLLSRGAPPGCLTAFQYTGLMSVLWADDLLFDRDDIRKLLDAYEVAVTDSAIGIILQESVGYPLGVVAAAQGMSGGKPFRGEITVQARRQVFVYFQEHIYKRFDLPVRRFLLELAPFEGFDPELARMVSGDPRAGELLEYLLSQTSMLRCDDVPHYHFWPQFRTFLLWEMEREYAPEKRNAIFSRGGLYYELKEDYAHALDCYTRAGDHAKVSELLIRNAEMHPGMGHYAQMAQYYRALPEAEILESPSLMQGMSMLCALAADYDGSEGWYRELEKFAEQRGKQDAAGKQARSRLAWLDIALPQRNVETLTETFPVVFRLLRGKEVSLPPFSVTSTLPSIMNGGKDFSTWSKKDDLLYQTLRIPVEAVLGKDGFGLADIGIAESKFEKGEDISDRMLSVMGRIHEIQQNGTPDIEFATVGLLCRSQLAAGHGDDAHHTLALLRARFEKQGQKRFLPNIDAMLCRIALQTGDLDTVESWYREKAPRNPQQINVMKRYQYLTQAMAELADGRPDAALLTLAPLGTYCQVCRRHIDGIHRNMLCAIALYRQDNKAWQEHLTAALDAAQAFSFIRTISIYGNAALPLLDMLSWDKDSKWGSRLMAALRMQAACYPAFLQPPLPHGEELTAAEMQVLRLICADRSNAEIGAILNIKLPTVKTHVRHILTKLNVSRRSEAKTAAKKLRLIPDDL